MVGDRAGTYLLAELEAVQLGHHQVGDDEVGHQLQSALYALTAVTGVVDAVALAEQRAHVVCHVGVVLDDEDTAVLVLGRRLGVELEVEWHGLSHGGQRGAVLVAYGDLDEEASPYAQLALDLDLSAHGIEDLPHQRQPDARAELAGLAIGLEEGLEDMLQRLGGDPDAAIGDLEDELTRLLPRPHPHPAALGGELEGIR